PEITLSPSKNHGWAARRCSTRASPLRPSFDGFLVEAAPFCIGGKSIAVRASLATSCCTSTKRQNSNPPPIGCKDRLVVTGWRESLSDRGGSRRGGGRQAGLG